MCSACKAETNQVEQCRDGMHDQEGREGVARGRGQAEVGGAILFTEEIIYANQYMFDKVEYQIGPVLYPTRAPEHSFGVQYPKTPKFTSLRIAIGTPLIMGVERTESRRRMKDTRSKRVSGVAGRSMTGGVDSRLSPGYDIVQCLVAYSSSDRDVAWDESHSLTRRNLLGDFLKK